MMARGVLSLRCRDVAEQFDVVQGGIAIGGAITVSVEARPRRSDAWPPVVMFCVDGAPIPAHGIGPPASWRCESGAEDNALTSPRCPRAHAYLTFHATDVAIGLQVVAVRDHEVDLELDATTEDPDHYDSAARPARWTGRVTLPRRAIDELWVPS